MFAQGRRENFPRRSGEYVADVGVVDMVRGGEVDVATSVLILARSRV
jgi:hypothetical protein